ncbi:MAG: non-specific serine/threonine protein kinase [Alteromonadaceae bacterium]|jgi:non-specific serine/threonine protein kinase
MTSKKPLQHFYIAEEQSIYLLNQVNSEKLKRWISLCQRQLALLGYRNISLLGKGAYGFVFNGEDALSEHHVFKFSRINLPLKVQNRLADEADIQAELNNERIPQVHEYRKVSRQSILHMSRAPGIDLEELSLKQGPLPPELVVSIAIQLADILLYLRDRSAHLRDRIYVHGDIKPSNVVYDENTGKVYLVDWGSAVYAQMDAQGQSTANNIMELMSGDLHNTNARMGDIYFIGQEQLDGALSSPRFDEQGLAATVYALASGQSCRYGTKVIPPCSLGLPKLLAKVLDAMLSNDPQTRRDAGDYFFNQLRVLKLQVLANKPTSVDINALIPVWIKPKSENTIDTVVYGSRKSFLRKSSIRDGLRGIDDVQLEKYYKNFLMGMGNTEKAFIAALGRLGRFPVVGGLVIRWEENGVYIDSSLTLFDPSLQRSFKSAVNNMIYLARGIHRVGTFKSCLFNARDTLHFEREDETQPFIAPEGRKITFNVSALPDIEDITRLHSYFEDGKDPDEYLYLPDEIMAILAQLNLIHHTGCIIVEVLPTHLKIHSYLMLLDHDKVQMFTDYLARILKLLPTITGLGILGFMKLPYKDTRFFEHIDHLPDRFYPLNPKV